MTECTRRKLCQFAAAAGSAWALRHVAGCSPAATRTNLAQDQPASEIVTCRRQGSVPLVAVEGTAYECGKEYGERVLQDYPGYRRYLDLVGSWRRLTAETTRLFERRAPYVLEIYRGLADAVVTSATRHAAGRRPVSAGEACTSFAVSGSLTADGQPLSGQTKDTNIESADLYIVLRMRIRGGPTILVLSYPGEILGYGLWSTGMSLFRNTLYSRAGEGRGLSMEQWGLLALAGRSTDDAADLAMRHGISTTANCLICDSAGHSLNVESNTGGVSAVGGKDGVTTHANHPTGEKTSPLEDYPNAFERDFSRWRATHLNRLLRTQSGRLSPSEAMACLGDHSRYPYGLCRHLVVDNPRFCTTGAVVAEPGAGRLHVVRGNPCVNMTAVHTM